MCSGSEGAPFLVPFASHDTDEKETQYTFQIIKSKYGSNDQMYYFIVETE